jgi:hypothetical protein
MRLDDFTAQGARRFDRGDGLTLAVLKPKAVPAHEVPGLACGIPLCGRGGVIRAFVMVDAEDVEWAMRYRWSLTAQGYATRGTKRAGKQRHFLMHRELLGLDHGDKRECDHRNLNRLDNRRSNLRVATRGQNAQNVPARGGSSKYRGVSWDKERRKWVAWGNQSRHIYLGRFDREEDAADAAARFRETHMPYSTN